MKTLSARNRAESRVASSVHTAKLDAPLSTHDARIIAPAEQGKNANTMMLVAAIGGGFAAILLGGAGVGIYALVRSRRKVKRTKKRRCRA